MTQEKKSLPIDPLEITTDQECRKVFLRHVNRAWLIFGIVTLASLPFFPGQRSAFIFLIAVTFPSYLITRFLNLSGRTRLAGVVFTLSVNFGFYGLFMLLVGELGAYKAFETEEAVWMLMGLAVLFAGAFVDKRAAPVLAALNTILLIGTQLTLAPESDPRPSAFVFWWMMALTIWLYDGTLQEALRRSRAKVMERKQVETERQALTDIMQGLVVTKNLQDFLSLVHNSIAKVIYAENFFVILYNKDTALFDEVYSVDKFDPPAHPSRLEKSISAHVFRSGQPFLSTQTRFDELVMQGEVELVGTNSPSWLGVPLKTSGKETALRSEIIGVMVVQDYDKPNRYTERDIDFLASIAGQVALVIERKQAEEALRESEEKFRLAFDTSLDSISISRLTDGVIVSANKGFLQISGYTQEEVIGKVASEINSWKDPEDRRKFVEEMQSRGEVRNYEARLLTSSGEIYGLMSASIINLFGKPHVLATTRDITARKRSEEALQLQNRLQELLMNMSTTYINLPLEAVESAIRVSLGELAEFVGADRSYIFDYDFHKQVGSNTYEWCGEGVEPTIAQLQEIPMEAVPELVEVHRRGESFYVPDVRSLPPGAVRDIVEQGSVKSFLTVPLMSSGECIGFVGFDWVKQQHAYSDNEQRLLTVFANMLVNIQQRKTGDATLRESEERFRHLSTLTSEGIMIHEGGVILDANQAFAELVGSSNAANLIGKNGLEIIPFLSESRQRILAHLRTGSTETYEVELVKSDGSILPAETHSKEITYRGRQARLVSMSDITARKQAEEALQESETRYRTI
jgi:PAS domain S-box-containing protein